MSQEATIAKKKSLRYRFAHLHRLIRIEGDSPLKKALAVGLGCFIGFTPLYGLHLAICLGVAHLFKLNKVLTYLSSYVNNPFITPLVIYLEFGVGRMILQGQWPNISFSHFNVTNLLQTGLEIFLGSLIIGSLVGLTLGIITYLATRNPRLSAFKSEMIEQTAEHYLPAGILNWEFVRGKLNYDPVYFYLLKHGMLTESKCIWDLGCGRGILLCLLATAKDMVANGDWEPEYVIESKAESKAEHKTDWNHPPKACLNGLEQRQRDVKNAQVALGNRANIVTASIEDFVPQDCVRHTSDQQQGDTYLLIDVLMYLPAEAQERVLARLKMALPVDGRIIVREADTGAGWRYHATSWAERFRAILRGKFSQQYHYRSVDEWTELFQQGGFCVEILPMSEGTPFCNQLFLITHKT